MVNIWFGVGIASLGNAFKAIGYIIEKHAHNRMLEENIRNKDNESQSYVISPLWQFGFFVFAVGSLTVATSYGFGPQSLLTPLHAIVLVTNSILAPIVLKEPFSCIEFGAVSLIVFSCVGAIYFGPKENNSYDVDEMLTFFQNSLFVYFSLSCILFTFIDYVFIVITQRRFEKKEIELDGDLSVPGATFLMVSYCWQAAALGSCNVLFLKIVAELFVETFSGNNQFFQPFSYFFLTLFIAINFVLEYWKQKALQTFGATYVVPIYQIGEIVGGIILGSIFFDELSELSELDFKLFSMSILTTAVGVYILAHYSGQKHEDYETEIMLKTSPVLPLLPGTSPGLTKAASCFVTSPTARNDFLDVPGYKAEQRSYSVLLPNDPLRKRFRLLHRPTTIIEGGSTRIRQVIAFAKDKKKKSNLAEQICLEDRSEPSDGFETYKRIPFS